MLLAKVLKIFDTINNKQIKYNELKLGLKNILLKTPNFQKKFKEINNDLVLFIDGIFDEIFYYEMSNFKNTKNIVLGGGGNIDARFIKENIAKNLHINFKRREDSLRTIKTNRNHLAHGEKSYIECSQDKTLEILKNGKQLHLITWKSMSLLLKSIFKMKIIKDKNV